MHQALRRGFQKLESNQREWTLLLGACSPLVVSVGGLAQQLRALSQVQLPDTPLRAFPDLGERLRFKLLHALDTVLVQLQEHV